MSSRCSGPLLVAAFGLLSTLPASAATIEWKFKGIANGTLVLSGEPTTIVNEPYTLEATYDTNAENLCGSNSSSGDYVQLTAFVTFLGYRYQSGAFVESNSEFGSCLPGGRVVFRFFPNSDTTVKVNPKAASVRWEQVSATSSGDGALIVMLPDPSVLGSLPALLPAPPLNAEFLGIVGSQLTLTDVTATVHTVP